MNLYGIYRSSHLLYNLLSHQSEGTVHVSFGRETYMIDLVLA